MQLGQHTHRTILIARLAAVTIIGLLGLTALAATPALAKTFNVNKRGDHVPGKCNAADCTLREAVIKATAKPSDDKIKLPSTSPTS